MQLTRDLFAIAKFLFNVLQYTAHVIDIGWKSVCPSITRWYCVETAQPIVKLSSLPGSSIILVF